MLDMDFHSKRQLAAADRYTCVCQITYIASQMITPLMIYHAYNMIM